MSFWSASTKTQRLGVRKLHNTRSSQNVVSKTVAVSVHIIYLQPVENLHMALECLYVVTNRN